MRKLAAQKKMDWRRAGSQARDDAEMPGKQLTGEETERRKEGEAELETPLGLERSPSLCSCVSLPPAELRQAETQALHNTAASFFVWKGRGRSEAPVSSLAPSRRLVEALLQRLLEAGDAERRK
jgi:hypothetical protein